MPTALEILDAKLRQLKAFDKLQQDLAYVKDQVRLIFSLPEVGDDGYEDLWLHEEDNCEHNHLLITDALMGGNARVRLRTHRTTPTHIGSSINPTDVDGPHLDMNGLTLYWYRAANQGYLAESPGPNGEIEWRNLQSEREHFEFTRCRDALIKNGTIQGLNTIGSNATATEKEAAIVFRNCPGAIAQDILAKEVHGDGIHLRMTEDALPNEYIQVLNYTCETIGRQQAAWSNFFHLTVNGFYTSPLSTYTQGGTTNWNVGKSPRSAWDIEMTTRADAGGVQSECGWGDFSNFTLGCLFNALSNQGAGYVHDIRMHHGTLVSVGQQLALIQGQFNGAYAKRANFEFDHITWGNIGGSNRALTGRYIFDSFKVHDNDIHDNGSPGKVGISMEGCEGVEIQDNNFTGGFTILYDDVVVESAQTALTYSTVAPTDGAASSLDNGEAPWIAAVAEAWTNPGNAQTSDNNRATADLTAAQKTNDLRFNTFGLVLEPSSTPTGITVRVEGKAFTASTLVNDVTDITTTEDPITVDDTTAFPATGTIRIIDGVDDWEDITYGSKTATTFATLTRGVNGTSPRIHVDNAEVYQMIGTARVQLVVGGVLAGTVRDKQLSPKVESTEVSFGGAADLWGIAGLTQAQVEAANFGFYLALLEGGAITIDAGAVRSAFTFPVGPSDIVLCSNNVPACPP